MLGVERWAEIRRLALVEGLSQREIRRRTGAGRDTIRKAVGSTQPPSYSRRPRRPSKLDPYRAEIERLLAEQPTLSGVRILEEIQLLGYRGAQTILDELLREYEPTELIVVDDDSTDGSAAIGERYDQVTLVGMASASSARRRKKFPSPSPAPAPLFVNRGRHSMPAPRKTEQSSSASGSLPATSTTTQSYISATRT